MRRQPGLAGDEPLERCDGEPALAGDEPLERPEELPLGRDKPLAAALRRYRRTHRRRLGGHHRRLAAGARARQADPVQRLLFAAAAHDPRTAALLARYAERSIPPSRLLAPRTLGRAAYRAARGAGRSATAASSASSAAAASGWRPPGGSSA